MEGAVIPYPWGSRPSLVGLLKIKARCGLLHVEVSRVSAISKGTVWGCRQNRAYVLETHRKQTTLAIPSSVHQISKS